MIKLPYNETDWIEVEIVVTPDNRFDLVARYVCQDGTRKVSFRPGNGSGKEFFSFGQLTLSGYGTDGNRFYQDIYSDGAILTNPASSCQDAYNCNVIPRVFELINQVMNNDKFWTP